MTRHGQYMAALKALIHPPIEAGAVGPGVAPAKVHAAAVANASTKASGPGGAAKLSHHAFSHSFHGRCADRDDDGEREGRAARRRLLSELLIKCADTSNVLKPLPAVRQWAVSAPLGFGFLTLIRRRGSPHGARCRVCCWWVRVFVMVSLRQARITREFFSQGDLERALGLPISMVNSCQRFVLALSISADTNTPFRYRSPH
jgi:hypothetical protein